MARTIKELEAQTEARFTELDAKLGQIIALMQGSAQGDQAKKAQATPKKEKPWLEPCPEYATSAQRAEYEKLAERAKGQREAMIAALGTQSVKAFIPVPKRDQARMPHTIQWSATYSK